MTDILEKYFKSNQENDMNFSLFKTQLNDAIINIKSYGAIGDGLSHTLRSKYNTLTEAQHVYPCAISLDDEIDFCSIQTALNDKDGVIFCPLGEYLINRTLTIPINKILKMTGIEGKRYSNTTNQTTILYITNNVTAIELREGSTVENGVIKADKCIVDYTADMIYIDGSIYQHYNTNIINVGLYGTYKNTYPRVGCGVKLDTSKGGDGYICYSHIDVNIEHFQYGIYSTEEKENAWQTNTMIDGYVAWCDQAILLNSGGYGRVSGLIQPNNVSNGGEYLPLVEINTDSMIIDASIWDIGNTNCNKYGLKFGSESKNNYVAPNTVQQLFPDKMINYNSNINMYFDLPMFDKSMVGCKISPYNSFLVGAEKKYNCNINKSTNVIEYELLKAPNLEGVSFLTFQEGSDKINDYVEIEIDLLNDQCIYDIGISFLYPFWSRKVVVTLKDSLDTVIETINFDSKTDMTSRVEFERTFFKIRDVNSAINKNIRKISYKFIGVDDPLNSDNKSVQILNIWACHGTLTESILPINGGNLYGNLYLNNNYIYNAYLDNCYLRSIQTIYRNTTPKQGEFVYDVDVKRPIWHDGINWVDTVGMFTNVPLSKNSFGKKGDFSGDDNYFYLCVKNNKWIRIKKDSTW